MNTSNRVGVCGISFGLVVSFNRLERDGARSVKTRTNIRNHRRRGRYDPDERRDSARDGRLPSRRGKGSSPPWSSEPPTTSRVSSAMLILPNADTCMWNRTCGAASNRRGYSTRFLTMHGSSAAMALTPCSGLPNSPGRTALLA